MAPAGRARYHDGTCRESRVFMHRYRLGIAAFEMWGLAFSQAAIAAHACALLSPSGLPAQTAASHVQPMHTDCAGMANQSHSTLNVCLSHCNGSDQSSANADIPTAAVAPQPALSVRLSTVCVTSRAALWSLALPAKAPPPRLRFSRFLI